MYAISLQGEPEPLVVDRSGRGLGRGATATVYEAYVQGQPPLAAKIFNDRASMDPRRIRCLLEKNPRDDDDLGDSGFSFAWPLALVSPNRYAQSAEGFLMPRVDLSESFHLSACFSSPLKKSSTSPHWPLNIRLLVAARICAALDLLHSKGFVVSDFKPENIRVKKSGEVFFLIVTLTAFPQELRYSHHPIFRPDTSHQNFY